jgi:hypothetical protein
MEEFGERFEEHRRGIYGRAKMKTRNAQMSRKKGFQKMNFKTTREQVRKVCRRVASIC